MVTKVRRRKTLTRKQRELLIEGCKAMAKESLKVCKEWEHADAAWPEWKE